jgi:hypothetical protein
VGLGGVRSKVSILTDNSLITQSQISVDITVTLIVIEVKFDMSSTIFPRYKIVLFRIFKQLVVTICLVSMLFSSPALALASSSLELYVPTGGVKIDDHSKHWKVDKYIEGSDDSNFSLGAMAGAILGGFGSVSLVSIAGSITGLSAAGISTGLATVGGVVGGGMVAGLVVSAALPVAGVAGGLLVVQSINHAWTSHQQENDRSME